MCPDTGLSYKDPAPHTFSFNSPHGACKKCKGLGFVNEVAMEKIIPDNSLSIHAGESCPWENIRLPLFSTRSKRF